MTLTVYPQPPAGLTTDDRSYIAAQSTNPTELASALASIDVEGGNASYGTATADDVAAAQAAILAATVPAGTIRQFRAGQVPAGWTQFSGPPASYSSYLPVSLMPGLSAGGSGGVSFVSAGSYGLHMLTNASGTQSHKRFDESTGTWVTLTNAPVTFSSSVALGAYVALADGRILLASISAASATNSARVYDPASGTWTSVANMPAVCRGGGGERLSDGRVYVCGDATSAYLYDPSTNSWAAAAKNPLQSSFGWCSYMRLPSGKLLSVNATTYAVYNPASDTWTTGALPGSVSGAGRGLIPTATGAVLADTPSASDTSPSHTVLYTEATDTWATSSVPYVSLLYSNAAPLSDGTYVGLSLNSQCVRMHAGNTPAATVWAYKN